MSSKNFRFTTSAPRYNGALCIAFTYYKKVEGRPSRSYRKVQGLKDPNYKHWDDNEQRFMEPSQCAMENNQLLQDLKQKADQLLKAYTFTNGAQFFEALFNDVKPSQGLTLAEFVSQRIGEIKENLTGNFQGYISLLNNLLGQGCKGTGLPNVKSNIKHFTKPSCDGVDLADTPLAEIGNKHLAAFASWVKTVKNGSNYRNLNVVLLAVVNCAKQRGLNTQIITYKHRSDAPRKSNVKAEEDTVFTPEEFDRIIALQGKNLSNKGGKFFESQKLYLDACILMYYTLSRDLDVLSFRTDMIQTAPDGKKYLIYIPQKKRNHRNAAQHTVKLLLCDQALAIIDKYKGQSKGGYLLPFPMNEQEWNISDPEQYKRRDYLFKKATQCINAHLKKVAKMAHLKGDLTMYCFRRSVITHLALKRLPLHVIAKQAGTSLKMLEKHYLKDLQSIDLFESA